MKNQNKTTSHLAASCTYVTAGSIEILSFDMNKKQTNSSKHVLFFNQLNLIFCY